MVRSYALLCNGTAVFDDADLATFDVTSIVGVSVTGTNLRACIAVATQACIFSWLAFIVAQLGKGCSGDWASTDEVFCRRTNEISSAPLVCCYGVAVVVGESSVLVEVVLVVRPHRG